MRRRRRSGDVRGYVTELVRRGMLPENPDPRVMELYLQVAAGREAPPSLLWQAKILYNQVMVEAGRIPQPDTEIRVLWTTEELRRARDQFRHYGGMPQYLPGEMDLLILRRRWHFPNGIGVSVSYNAENPLPGRAPFMFSVPLREHEQEAASYRYSDEFRAVSTDFAGDMGRGATSTGFLTDELPASDWFMWSGTPRFRLSDDEELLRLLKEVADAPPGENPWSIEWDDD